MPKKIQNTTKAHLVSVSLPNHGASYTVISHQFVIDYAYQALANAGFAIVDEEYRCTADGQIAQGIYKLNFNNDPELSMMFAWTNSYNKQVKFKCVVGAYINNSGSVMISGDIGTWVRKHTGSADTETKDTIDNYISNAYLYYNQLCADKASMEGVSLNKRRQSQLLGVLFAEYEILTTEQASMIRDQMKKPQQVFANTDSLWAFYNFVTNSLQHSHPKTWMEDQRILHYFIGTICNFAPANVPVVQVPDNQVVQEEDNYADDLHQLNEVVEETNEAEETPFDIDEDDDAVLGSLLVPIENPEPPITVEEYLAAKESVNDEEISPENSEDIFPQDGIVHYTDAVGNTFEAPIVSNLNNLNSEIKEEVIDSQYDFDLEDFVSEDTEEESDDIPDFF